MTQFATKYQNTFIGLFGKPAGLKLMNWLDPCCNTFCEDVLSCVETPPSVSAINSTATATTAQILGGVITSTSVAPVTITLPTATALGTALGAARGTVFNLVVDNSAGANTVTVALGSGITAPAGAITGGTTLTVSTTNKVGIFKFYFTSATTAVVFRTA